MKKLLESFYIYKMKSAIFWFCLFVSACAFAQTEQSSFSWTLLRGDCDSTTYLFEADDSLSTYYAWDFGPASSPRNSSNRKQQVTFTGNTTDQPVELCLDIACQDRTQNQVLVQAGFEVELLEVRNNGCGGIDVGAFFIKAFPDGNYTYTLADGTSNSTGTFRNKTSQTYIVTVVPADLRINCERRLEVEIVLDEGLPQPSYDVQPAGDGCTRERFVFKADSIPQYDVQYIWKFGSLAIPETAMGLGPHEVHFTGPEGARIVELKVKQAVCNNELSFSVDYEKDIKFIVDIRVQPVGCDNPNFGTLNVSVDPEGAYLYSLDGSADQRSGVFQGVPTGNRVLSVRRAGRPAHCDTSFIVSVGESPIRTPLFNEVQSIASSCQSVPDGKILSEPPTGSMLKLNGSPPVNDNTFDGLAAGEYTLTLTSADGCYRDTSIVLLANPDPQLSLGANFSAEFLDTVTILADYRPGTSPLVSFDWILGSTGETLFEDQRKIDFQMGGVDEVVTLILMEESGCEAKDEVLVEVLKTPALQMPTAFSPNKDGINDILYPRSRSSVSKVLSLDIFDRWGGHIFEVKDFVPNDSRSGWDGQYRQQPAGNGLYVYVIRFTYSNGTEDIVTGSFSLLR